MQINILVGRDQSKSWGYSSLYKRLCTHLCACEYLHAYILYLVAYMHTYLRMYMHVDITMYICICVQYVHVCVPYSYLHMYLFACIAYIRTVPTYGGNLWRQTPRDPQIQFLLTNVLLIRICWLCVHYYSKPNSSEKTGLCWAVIVL